MFIRAELIKKHPDGDFSEDSETMLWLCGQREEHNLLYQSRFNSDTKHCDDLMDGLSTVEFRQAKQPWLINISSRTQFRLDEAQHSEKESTYRFTDREFSLNHAISIAFQCLFKRFRLAHASMPI
jgi:hypothetical protein